MEEYIILKDSIKFFEKDFLDNGKVILNEKTIQRNNNVVIKVCSSEKTSHNRPHVHVIFDDKEYPISIDNNIELLGNNIKCRPFKYIVQNYFNKENIQKFRKAWNENTDSPIIFEVINNIYTDNLINRE